MEEAAQARLYVDLEHTQPQDHKRVHFQSVTSS